MLRAGPLSDSKVISLLNRFYVPVYVSNEDFGPQGQASDEEKKVYWQLDKFARVRDLPRDAVCAFIIAPDGKILACRPRGYVITKKICLYF